MYLSIKHYHKLSVSGPSIDGGKAGGLYDVLCFDECVSVRACVCTR